jgi:drug/metabolite transporter (DMT)-like permease
VLFLFNHPGDHLKLRIWIALLAIYLIWGSTYLAIRFAVGTIPPFLMAGTRFLVAGIILYGWRRMAGDPAPTARQWGSTVVTGLLLLLGGNGLVSWAEQNVASGIAALMIGSVPLWMVLIEAIRPGGVRPNRIGIIGLCVGFGGIILLVAPWQANNAVTGTHLLGASALLLAAFLWSLGSIYSRSADLPKSSLLTTGMEMLGGAIGLYIAGTLTGEWQVLHLASITTRSWMGLAYLIVFGSLIGFAAYAWLLRVAPVSLVATYAYVNPVVAILLGSFFAQEVINARILAAAIVIVGAVVLINNSSHRKIEARTATIQ